MKYFSVITSMNQSYYHRVGKKMITSFIKNWPEDVNLYIYTEEKLDIEGASNNNRIKIINILEKEPDLEAFITRAKKRNDYFDLVNTVKKGAVRFSYKSFAIIHGTSNPNSKFTIWMDADMITHSKVDIKYIESICNEDSYRTYMGRKDTFTEVGFQIFNTNHPQHILFINTIKNLYISDAIYNIDEWHDGWLFDFVRKIIPTTDIDLTPDGKGYQNVITQTQLFKYFDHLKGETRKKVGSSLQEDLLHIKGGDDYVKSIASQKNKSTSIKNMIIIKSYLKTLFSKVLRKIR